LRWRTGETLKVELEACERILWFGNGSEDDDGVSASEAVAVGRAFGATGRVTS
jgi:hypothetical protein